MGGKLLEAGEGELAAEQEENFKKRVNFGNSTLFQKTIIKWWD